ncbi:MAG: hypothetical protein LWX52_00445 [Deltaproteobacteria bacterium]|jgi:hypothetical protein|nr:hypothetical protein [Deltaproteobacteria bacterium]
MKKHPHTLPPYIINLFFIIGLLSAVAFRIIIVFQHIRPELFRPVWYFGVIGYMFFFLYRYVISLKRKRAIHEYNLISKLQGDEKLSSEDREVAVYLLSSLKKSRENLNYLFIFALSGIAVVIDILLSMQGE